LDKLAPRPSLLAPRRSLLAPRTGISLLEILISMFVLLFGLMGVAAIFPVGNHYAAKGDQFDRGAAMADAALAELTSRGFLNPQQWLYAGLPPSGTVTGDSLVIQPPLVSGNLNPTQGQFNLQTAAGPGHAFVIDPVGAANTTDTFFPFQANSGNVASEWSTGPVTLSGNAWPIRRVTFPQNANLALNAWTKLPTNIAEATMRLHDDVTVSLPVEDDRPGIQRWITVDNNPTTGAANNTPNSFGDDTPLTRAYSGNYSWLATVVPQSIASLVAMQPANLDYGAYNYDVSVAVFLKREGEPSETTERWLSAVLGPGGDLLLYSNSGSAMADVDDALEDIRASHWIALAGMHPNGTFLLKWYKLLSLDDETDTSSTQFYGNSYNAVRHAMVAGPDWPQPTTGQTVQNLRVLLVPNVIAVATQSLKLEPQ
jgi:hypothetical protein